LSAQLITEPRSADSICLSPTKLFLLITLAGLVEWDDVLEGPSINLGGFDALSKGAGSLLSEKTPSSLVGE